MRSSCITRQTTDADTVMNPTNHTYFNLAGHDSGKILDQTVSDARGEGITRPVHDHQAIPTGEIAPVAGTPMDFTTCKADRQRYRGGLCSR